MEAITNSTQLTGSKVSASVLTENKEIYKRNEVKGLKDTGIFIDV